MISPPSRRLKVQVWIWRGIGIREVLLLKTNSTRGGFWQPVTGGVEPAEPVEEAALREAREETGLDFGSAVPVAVASPFQYQRGDCTFDEFPFSLEAPAQGEIRLDPREHVEYQWVSPAEALGRLKFASNADVLRVLSRLGCAQ